MLRQLGTFFSIALLATPTVLPVLLSPKAAIAQTSTPRRIPKQCDVKQDFTNRLATLFSEARDATNEQGKTQESMTKLGQALAYLPQISDTQSRAYFVNFWNSVYADVGYWSKLTQQVKGQRLESSYLPLLDRYVELLDSLPSGYSYLKTVSLADLALQYHTIGYSQKSMTVFAKSRQASQSIQGEIFKGKALMYIAQKHFDTSQLTATGELLDRALQSLQQVPSDQARYTYDPLVNLAQIYAQLGNETQAEQIAAALPTNPDYQSSAWKSIAQALIEAQELDRAEQITSTLRNTHHRADLLGKLAVAYYSSNLTQSNQLFDRALQTLPEGDPIAVETLIEQYLEVGQFDSALELGQARLNSSILSDTMKSVVLAYAKAGQTEKVQQLLSEEITRILAEPEEGWRDASFDLLIPLAAQAQQFDWILQQYPQLPLSWRSSRPTLLPTVVAEYAKTGQWETVRQWVDGASTIDTPLSGTYMLAALAREAYNAGNREWANDIFDRAFRAANALEPPDLKADGLGEIALAYAQTGQEEPSLNVLSQAILAAKQTHPETSASVLDTLSWRFQKAQQWLGVFQIGMNYPSVIPKLAEQNRAGLVQQALESLPDAASKTQGLLLWANHFWNIQERDKALPLLDKALQLAKTVPGDESIVDRLGAEGGTIIEMQNDRGSLIEAVAVEYALWGEFDKAYTTATLLQDETTRNNVLRRLNCR